MEPHQRLLATPPSRKRQLLALYIDYLVFTAFYKPIAWAIHSAGPAETWLVTMAVFFALRTVAAALNAWLPGQWALGMDTHGVAGVKPEIRAKERWWTAAAGTLLVLEGSKNLVRWTQGLPIPPVLGSTAPEWVAAIAITVLGTLNVLAGLLTLRTLRAGPVIGLGVVGVEAVAAIVHREAFREWAAQAVIARRALQGIRVRDGEIQMMQSLATTILPVVAVIGAIWLLAVAIRFKR